jgi:hypothetical protein
VVLIGSEASADTPSIAVGATISGVQDTRDVRLPGTTTAAGFNVEVFVSPRRSVAFEADFPHMRAYDFTSLRNHSDGSSDRSTFHSGFRDPTMSVTVGWHFRPREWADLAVVTGGALERRIFTESVHDETLDRSGAVVKQSQIDFPRDVFTWPQAVGGLDVAFSFHRLSIGPQIRLFVDPIIYEGCCFGARTVARLAIRWPVK